MSIPLMSLACLPFRTAKRAQIDALQRCSAATGMALVGKPYIFAFNGKAGFMTTPEHSLADVKTNRGELNTGLKTPMLTKHPDPKTLLETLDEEERSQPRFPRSVQAIYLRPLKRQAYYGLPCCDLQLRSYSIRNLEFFADFALRAAYYLKLPAAGPVPLPRITETWTVPRSSFIHKKSKENFRRITLRRLLQIQDGHPETVEIWLAFLRKHAYYGIGMKANVWEHEKLGVGKSMDVNLENLKQVIEPKWAHFGRKKNLDTSEKVMEMLESTRFRKTTDGPLSGM